MGRHRSRSRSKSPKKHKHHRDHRDYSRDHKDRSREKQRDRSRERSGDRYDSKQRKRSISIDRSERKSKFDLDPAGQKAQRKSKWSDQPPDPAQNIYDPNRARMEAQNLIAHITINPEVQNAQHKLVDEQSKLFSDHLSKAKFDSHQVRTRVETIRPNNDPFRAVLGKEMGTAIMSTLSDNSKIKRKIYIPKDTNFNFTGLIIGPKGANQKRLEEETGCKILVRGLGSQKEGQPPQPDDHEEQHVLIVGENEIQIAKATAEIERILFADEETRVKIRQEQLKLVAQLKNDPNVLISKGITVNGEADLSMTTPYGPPSADAYVIRVPNDCVGLVIGKGGETIRQLQVNSGAKKVQIATESAKGANFRNLFVDGERDAYERVQQMVREIVEQQQRIKQASTGILPDNTQGIREEVPVPDNLVGLVIGRGGENIRAINQRSGAVVFIPKESDPGRTDRYLIVSGTPEQVEHAKREINEKVQEGQRNLQLKALQASGIPIQLMQTLGYGDPNFFQQYLSSFDPAYAAMYQQMYAQQPVVTTVTDSASLPGSQPNYQGGYQQYQYPQQQQQQQQQQQIPPNYTMLPEYMMNYQAQIQNQAGTLNQGIPFQSLPSQGLQQMPKDGNWNASAQPQ